MGGARVAAATAIALAGALLAAVACQQVLSIDGTVTVAAGGACGLGVGTGSCQACVASSCCSQAAACAASQPCSGYETCLLGCGADYACRNQCVLDHPSAHDPTVTPLDQCLAASCSDTCSMTCGLTAVPSDPDAAPACEACIGAKACSAVKACAVSSECEGIEHCAAGCSTLDCHDACMALDDAGTFTALAVALISTCIQPCHLGNLWGCVGKVDWPLAPAGVEDVDFTALDLNSGQGLPRAGVKACDKTDDTCAFPRAQATADDAGRGVLALPPLETATLGFQGYYEIDTSTEMPWLVFSSSPLTRSQAPLSWSLISQSTFKTASASVGVVPDSQRGHILVEALDCVLAPASGVTFSATGIDAKTRLFYFSGGALTNLTSETDITGYAFFANVPIGNVTVTATPKAFGKPSSSQIVFTRPGAVSSVVALPTP